MTEINHLRQQVFSTGYTPRETLVTYIKALGAEAKQLAPNEREARGDYTNKANKFPQTKGEDIASDIQSGISQQDWVRHDTDDDLEEVAEIAGSLEINTDDHKLWQELFEKIDNLSD
jgi:hypothetical protein